MDQKITKKKRSEFSTTTVSGGTFPPSLPIRTRVNRVYAGSGLSPIEVFSDPPAQVSSYTTDPHDVRQRAVLLRQREKYDYPLTFDTFSEFSHDFKKGDHL